jgi:ParB family chromosome partitioning protein
MSLKDLKRKSESALEVLPANPGSGSPRRPITAPGATAMMQPTIDALNDRAKVAEKRAAELDERVKDLESLAIPVAAIGPNPWQPRCIFDETEIQKLADSILEIGLIQPIVVRRVQSLDTETGSVQTLDIYQLIAGERRWRAHKLLGKTEIKATIIEAGNDDLAIMALVENLGRQDLTDYEIAKALRRAEIEFPNRKHMVQALGMERSDLYRYFAFNDLPADIKGDLDVNPRLLGRSAASAIQSMIRKYGDDARNVVSKLWTRVKSGDLDQGKIAAAIEATILRGDTPKTDRDIRKLFVGKEQAGSLTRDASHLTIKIKVAALTSEKEAELRVFVERMLG